MDIRNQCILFVVELTVKYITGKKIIPSSCFISGFSPCYKITFGFMLCSSNIYGSHLVTSLMKSEAFTR